MNSTERPAEDASLLNEDGEPHEPDLDDPTFDDRRRRLADREPQRHGKFTQLEVILTLVCVFLLVLMSVFAGLYARGRTNKVRKPPAPEPVPVPPPEENHTIGENPCLEPQCIITAARIFMAMDNNTDPCDDFFQYACGGWMRQNVIPDDKGRYGAFEQLYEDNQQLLRDILENDYSFGNDDNELPPPDEPVDRSNFYQLQMLYNSCMNETLITGVGPKPLREILDEILRLFPVPGRGKNLDTTALINTLVYLSRIGVHPFLMYGVEPDAKQPDWNAVHLYQGELGLPSKEYYEKDNILDVYKSVLAELLDKAFEDQRNAVTEDWDTLDQTVMDIREFGRWKEVANRVVEFEMALAKLFKPAEYFNDPDAIYNPTSRTDLDTVLKTMNSTSFLHELTKNVPKQIILFNREYFSELNHLIETTPPDTLQAYFLSLTVLGYSNHLDEQFRAPMRRLRATVSGIDENVRPKRWETCLSEVDNIMGQLAGRYFMLRAFAGDSRTKASQLIGSIKHAFINRLHELDWLGNQTRDLAIEKVDVIDEKVGYPTSSPNADDPNSLAKYYIDLHITKSYFNNVVNSKRWKSDRRWKRVGEKVDRDLWYMTPPTVNAYYNPTANEIVFPAGILQSPFFEAVDPEYINFGGIGVVIGHELTHAFDNSGRKYDKDGRLHEWWTEETIKAFDKQAQCFVEQYSNFTMDTPNGPVNVNGKLTLGENLADNGGLKAAYDSWLHRFESDPKQKKYVNHLLPGMDAWNLTRDKVFYLSYARPWCSRIRPEAAMQRILNDPHSPAIWRVNGAVQNSKHFAETFGCHKGSPMNPHNKCVLW